MKNRSSLLWGAILSLALGGLPAYAQGAQPASPVSLTLSDALRRALDANPALGRARSQIGVAQAQKDLAVSSILPHLNLTGAAIRNSREAQFSVGGQQVTILPQDDWNTKLNLTQPIYAGNRERRALDQARLAVEIARQGTATAEEQLLLGVVADYLGVVEGDALIEVEKKNIALARDRREQAQNLFDAGETTRVDVLRALADTKAAERRLAEAQRERDQSESRLRVDLALDQPLRVAPPGTIFPRLAPEAVLLSEAERQRPEMAQAAEQVENAKLEVRKQRGAYLPTLSATGTYLSQKANFPASAYGQLALNLTVPIFDSGEVKSRVAVAREEEHQAELQLAETRQAVREDVRRALVDLAAAEASLALAKDQLTASEAEHSQALDLYRAQETTALDLSTAEASLADARRAVATSQLDRDLAELRVWAAAGLLKKTLFEESAR